MPGRRTSAFLSGIFAGILLSLLAGGLLGYLLMQTGLLDLSQPQWSAMRPLFGWLERNLGWSLVPFSLTLLLYLQTLQRLSMRLQQRHSPQQVAQLIQLSDLWITLFIGIGVIWTAIGMRSALLYALGDIEHVASVGAFAVLQRLVDGGILTALSTTIVGGAGGYLMRLGKSFCLGPRINDYFSELEQEEARQVRRLLAEIRDAGRQAPPSLTALGNDH